MSKKGHSNSDDKNKNKSRDNKFYDYQNQEHWKDKYLDPIEFGTKEHDREIEEKHEKQFDRPPEEQKSATQKIEEEIEENE